MKHVELYHLEETDVAKFRKRKALAGMIVIGAIGLFACILLCTLTTRKNSGTMMPIIIITSIVAGWIVIFLSHTFYGEARAVQKHDELMLTGDRETFVGSFRKTTDVHRVRNGVAVRKVLALVDERERVLGISESKAALLPETFTGRVETVYDFIAAFEVDGND